MIASCLPLRKRPKRAKKKRLRKIPRLPQLPQLALEYRLILQLESQQVAAPTAAVVAAKVAANPALRVEAVVAVHQTVVTSGNRAVAEVAMAAWVAAVADGQPVDLVSAADPDAVAVQPSGDLAVQVAGFAETVAADRNLK